MGQAFAPTTEERSELVTTRRDVHAHPELRYAEERTAGVVEQRLRALGYAPRTGVGRTGVVALLEGEAPGPCVLLRADMDALPIQEENDVDYRSTVPAVMHACGHDAHTAMALGTARILQRLGRPTRGSIKLMFQPAEEGGNGANAMIDDGVLEDPRVDAAFGQHVWNHLPVGKVAVVDGPFMAAVDEFRVRIVGRGGHGAMPHQARDPVVAAAHVVTALQTIVSRRVHPLESAVVTVGRIRGGEAFNVIPDEVELVGTMRSFAEDVWETMPDRLRETVEGAARACGCTAEIEIDRLMRPTVNDAAMADLVREVARAVVGAGNVVEERTMGGEDFAEVLARVPGCYFFVGSRNEATGKVHPHHSPRFDIDEAVLPIGAEMLARLAHRYLGEAAGA